MLSTSTKQTLAMNLPKNCTAAASFLQTSDYLSINSTRKRLKIWRSATGQFWPLSLQPFMEPPHRSHSPLTNHAFVTHKIYYYIVLIANKIRFGTRTAASQFAIGTAGNTLSAACSRRKRDVRLPLEPIEPTLNVNQ